jgi:hypothetical protein
MEDRQPQTLVRLRHKPCRKRQRSEGLKRSGRAPFLGHDDAVAGLDLHDLGVTVEVVEEGAPLVSVAGEAAPAHLDPAWCSAQPRNPPRANGHPVFATRAGTVRRCGPTRG